MVTLPEDFAMHSSQNANGGLLPEHSALQHGQESTRAPRPLPLFLDLVRQVFERDPDLARAALAGLRAYEEAPRRARSAAKPEVATAGGASLRDHGGSGPIVVLVPSLINPPRILDLDAQVSLTRALARMGRRALLLDWGRAKDRAELSVSGHVENLLLPLLRNIGEPASLVGYCLGGTMAIAAANLVAVERLATIAAPWTFAGYPESSKRALARVWKHSRETARELGALPMEVLQAAFWSLDPLRTVRKFAQFGKLDPQSAEARRFVELEEWANDGEPLPFPAAEELMQELFCDDLPGSSKWRIGRRTMSDKLAVPALHLTAEHDRIAPSETAPRGKRVSIQSGHVGMIVGSARKRLHEALGTFLDSRE